MRVALPAVVSDPLYRDDDVPGRSVSSGMTLMLRDTGIDFGVKQMGSSHAW